MDDKSAGFEGYARLLLNVLLSWGSEGVQRDAGGSIPLGVVATATIKGVKQIEFNLTPHPYGSSDQAPI